MLPVSSIKTGFVKPNSLMLAVELTDLKDMGFDLDLTGFTLDEFQAIIPIENYPESSAKEINPDDYKMSDTCPKCGFEFNAKT